MHLPGDPSNVYYYVAKGFVLGPSNVEQVFSDPLDEVIEVPQEEASVAPSTTDERQLPLFAMEAPDTEEEQRPLTNMDAWVSSF